MTLHSLGEHKAMVRFKWARRHRAPTPPRAPTPTGHFQADNQAQSERGSREHGERRAGKVIAFWRRSSQARARKPRCLVLTSLRVARQCFHTCTPALHCMPRKDPHSHGAHCACKRHRDGTRSLRRGQNIAIYLCLLLLGNFGHLYSRNSLTSEINHTIHADQGGRASHDCKQPRFSASGHRHFSTYRDCQSTGIVVFYKFLKKDPHESCGS